MTEKDSQALDLIKSDGPLSCTTLGELKERRRGFGLWLREQRLDRGLGLREFAALIDENTPNISAIERGTRKPWQDPLRLIRVAKALGFLEGSEGWNTVMVQSLTPYWQFEVDRLRAELAAEQSLFAECHEAHDKLVQERERLTDELHRLRERVKELER